MTAVMVRAAARGTSTGWGRVRAAAGNRRIGAAPVRARRGTRGPRARDDGMGGPRDLRAAGLRGRSPARRASRARMEPETRTCSLGTAREAMQESFGRTRNPGPAGSPDATSSGHRGSRRRQHPWIVRGIGGTPRAGSERAWTPPVDARSSPALSAAIAGRQHAAQPSGHSRPDPMSGVPAIPGGFRGDADPVAPVPDLARPRGRESPNGRRGRG